MIERLNPFVFSKEQEVKFSLAEWIWNSHYWIETYVGYYTCKWCKKQTTSGIGIGSNDDLCPDNPAVVKLREEIL